MREGRLEAGSASRSPQFESTDSFCYLFPLLMFITIPIAALYIHTAGKVTVDCLCQWSAPKRYVALRSDT